VFGESQVNSKSTGFVSGHDFTGVPIDRSSSMGWGFSRAAKTSKMKRLQPLRDIVIRLLNARSIHQTRLGPLFPANLFFGRLPY
jgi:hypothetical protein